MYPLRLCRLRATQNVVLLSLTAGLLLGALGCSSGGGSGSSNVSVANSVTVNVNPISPDLAIDGKQTFTATVTGAGNTAVTWSIKEGTAGGTITSSGTYIAPASAGTFHIVATSVADPTKFAETPIIVHLIVSVTPTGTTLTEGRSKTFTATVSGAANTTVTWSVQEGAAGGSINSSGFYTAPNVPGLFHVVATSQADPTQQASSLVTVQAPITIGTATGTIQ